MLANAPLDSARRLVDLVERLTSEEEEKDEQAIEQYHELLVELGVLGAIGTVGLNIVCGEMSHVHAKLFERAIASEVQKRAQAVFEEFEDRLGKIEVTAPSTAPANDAKKGPEYAWLRLTEEYRSRNPDLALDSKSHAFLVVEDRLSGFSVTSLCGKSLGSLAHWDKQLVSAVPDPCESCAKGALVTFHG